MALSLANWITEPDGEKIIKVGKEGLSAIPPRTIPDVFKESCSKFGSNKALSVKRNDNWETITFSEWYEQCIRVAKSLVAVGLKRFEGVSIMGFNSPEWMMADLGTIMAGGLATGIYTTNNVETTRFILENSRSRIAIGEHYLILRKLLEAGKDIKGLKFVQYSPGPVEESLKKEGVISWDEFLQLGKDVKTEEIEAIMSAQKPGHCCTLIYTSGTTGMPKGVMLSHDNLIYLTTVFTNSYKYKQGYTSISYLPLSHIGGQLFDIYSPLISGCITYFADRDAMVGTLAQTVKEVEPDIFLGLPAILLGMYTKIEPAVKSGEIKLEDVRNKLGFKNTDILITGSSHCTVSILEFFDSANMPISNAYGCTETTGPCTFPLADSNKYGSVGKIMESAELKIHQPNSQGEGEICIRGRHIFMGYLRNVEKTAEVIDDDNWFHTGDIGRVDSGGILWITSRIKELLIHSSGQNVIPMPIEDEMKKELKLCAFCVVVGESREYFNMLLTVKSKLSPEGTPTDELDEEAVGICKSLGVELSKVSEVMESPVVKKYIQEGIDRANERAMNHQCIIKDFAILPLNFTINTGELTPTAKLRRISVVEKYADVIKKMYS